MIPTIDFNQIAVDMEMDPEDILHLMTIYRDELQKDITALHADLAHQNWLPLKNKLHKMKGDAANLFLLQLAALFAEMETAAGKKDMNSLNEQVLLIRQLQSEFNTAFGEYAHENP